MFSRKAAFPSTRATAIAVAAVLALTAVVPTVASAGQGLTATGSMTDISARRRLYNPGAAAVAGVVGTGLAIAGAAAASRAYYDDGYGGGGPVYVAPAPGPYYNDGYGGYGGYGSYGSSVPPDQHGHPLASW
jgi:hypothetical protein